MIIGVDINPDRKKWGERFGMTHFVNPKEIDGDLVPHLVNMTKTPADQIGGADYTFDCTGNVDGHARSAGSCHRGWGESIIIGVAPAGAEIATRPFQLVTGRVWKGTAFGGASGRTDVPKIVDWYMEGKKIEIDPMITHTMPLDDINKGFDLMHGRVDPQRRAVLTELIAREFPVDMARQGIFGHSMGGHGALTLALKAPGRYRSVSAFAPICHPVEVDWGRKAFPAYLGDDDAAWRAHDAVCLIEDGARLDEILVDQGTADGFLDSQLRPGTLEAACQAAGIPLTLNLREGYDHSYFFISSFMADHVKWHADRLRKSPGV
jgi:hypothetical protein